MWSRRAQEYEAKINSGDPVSIAEVVRDLHRGDDQPDQSYSERQMYQAALDRLARELAALGEDRRAGRGSEAGGPAQSRLATVIWSRLGPPAPKDRVPLNGAVLIGVFRFGWPFFLPLRGAIWSSRRLENKQLTFEAGGEKI